MRLHFFQRPRPSISSASSSSFTTRSSRLAGSGVSAPNELMWPATALSAGLIAVTLAPAAVATADAHPHGSAYWNELIGGIPGGADKWFMRQFWGGSTRDGLDEVNRRAEQGALVYFHDAAWGAIQMYQREGWLRRDVRYTADPYDNAQLGVVLHGKDLDDYELDMMRTMQGRVPVLQSSLDGTPMVSVYERPKARSRAWQALEPAPSGQAPAPRPGTAEP